MKSRLQTLLLFVDGLGWAPEAAGLNPLFDGYCPLLARLLKETAIPIDARLGVPGLPQSATGQAALLTGLNAPALMGRHVEGLPGPQLKDLVREHNLFSALTARGYRATFANAYFTDDVREVRARRRQSVTTVAALEGLGKVWDTAAMLRHEAVYHDLTRRTLRERGYTGPLVTPTEAGQDLVALATRHDFTLFEYFLTDRVGHGGDPEAIGNVLRELDEFLSIVLEFARRPRALFLLTSDHGNIEDPSIPGHTGNPVPLVALGAGAEEWKTRVRALTDIAPALLERYP